MHRVIIQSPSPSRLLYVAIALAVLLGVATPTARGAIAQRGSSSTANNSGSSSTLTLTKPTGVVAGDVLFANISQIDVTTAPSLSGWTAIDGVSGTGPNRYYVVLYKVAGASEPASYAFNVSSSGNSVGSLVAFSGVNSTGGVKQDGTAGGPFDVDPGTINVDGNNSDNSVPATTLTTVTTNAAVIMFGMVADNQAWSAWATTNPASLTELYDDQWNGTGSSDVSVGAAWALKPTPGSTGSGAATLAASALHGAILIALKPATATTVSLSRTVGSSPAIYGDTLTFQATVSGSGGTPTGTVDFKDAGTTIATVTLSGGIATLTTNTLDVSGSPYSLTATYNGDSSFAASSSSAISQTITALAVNVTGSRTYDGTTLAAATSLAIANNLDGANLTLAGSGLLSSKDVGTRTLTVAETPVRVQSSTGNTGANAATTIPVTLAATTAGNTLVAVISTRGTAVSQVSGITGGGTWTRAAQSANANGTTTEIWYATNITAGVTSVTITQASLRSAAAVMEYNGILIASPLDQTASTTGNASAASTGTTPTTTQANELWIGGIGLTNSTTTLGTPNNSFTVITNAASTSGTASQNTRVYALENIVTSTGTANSGGTLTPTTSMWSGAVATFKAELPSGTTLALGGSAAGNYTLTGMSSSVTNTAKALTVSGLTASNKTYDGNATATLGGTAALSVAEAPGVGTTSDGKPYTGDTITLGGSPAGTFADANVGTGKAVTVTGSSLSGAQASNYSVTQQTGLTANITALVVTLSGSRTYDGTTEAAAANLTVSNSIGADVVTLTGSGTLSGKDVGSRTITAAGTSLRVNSAAGAVGASAATSFSVTLNSPQDGNTLIAVISTRRTSGSAVSSITQSGATWTRAVQTSGTGGTTTEIWSAPNVSSAGTTLTINLATSLFASAVVMEYQGVLTASAVDQTANNSATAGTSATTGTTATTTQGNEVWIGGIGLTNSTLTLSSLLNSFVEVTNSSSGGSVSNNAKVYALERIVTTTGTASSGGTVSASSRWSGALATFKAVSLGLSGADAGNYSLTGLTGSMTITTKSLTVSGITAANKVYDGTNTATLGGTAALLTAEAAGTGTTSDGKPYTLDTVTLGGTAAGAFADKHVGTAKAVTITGNTISGAQAGNYSVTQQTGLTANITARPITVTATSNTKVYDGTTSATATPSATVQSGDTANFTETYDTKNIGTTKTLTPAGTVTDGNSGTNYSYTFTPVSTGTITTKTLTMSGLSVPSSKVYDGTTTAVVSGSPGSLQTAEATGTGTTVDGKPYTGNGDVVSLTGTATGTYNSANVASATTVTFGGITLTGTGSTNYSLTTQSAASATITKATTTSVVASSGNPALPGASVRFTNILSVVLPGAGTPTGTIQFRTNSAAFGSAVSLSGLVANSVTTTSLPHGSNTVTAEYAGDGNFFGSTNSLSPSQVINTAPTASNASFVRAPGLSFKIRLSDLMTTNTADVDGDTNKLLSFGSSGQGATITTNASFLFYLPSTSASSNNNDSFTYTIKDGFGGTATATISITVVSAVGTAQSLTVSSGSVTVHCAGIPGYPYLIQRSTNLVNWTTLITTNAPSAGLFDYVDTSPPPSSAYYRTAQP